MPEIGELRWPVTIARRIQAPDTAGTGIDETLQRVADVRAKVEPLRPLTFWAAQQTETPVTHRIELRWVGYLDAAHVILRTTRLPDGSARTELFRVRRVLEVDGRKRFTAIEAELEKTA